ncbi:ArnT family glycosyltransferase [Tuwongella immobilis]|uniref:Glycosyltransferase RgtA/B/C/D-like domain-containing protein n=1 Tax=Tuwongella immobilis TaxID=692036 RepID=A0A6C2YUC6_9BACT|nr:glycosyltransferase family 39 protein [Tuwongella immobilis]VIP05096.1 Glycosyl transferase OS=Rhodomicrobium udaipurense JA643 GN=T281_04655 PE=4 SV=1: PMT_2: PMT_2 [Tuwongella immobilis]VTS07548.1 Glycosyl transferase OS=Rhodomicrobium udaipurense JA643 GN=T281_04655 PE=4 SV=1: PMT_2: PMT_2 [Tuwongella immobilis]
MAMRWFVALATAIFGVHLLLAAVIPPVDDELYYWAWSQELQFSYYDHPLMTALMIRGSTELFGNTVFAIRFPACVGAYLVLLMLGTLTRPSRVLLLLLLTPVLVLGSILITPDAPLFLFWTAYMLWLVRLHQTMTPPTPIGPIPGAELLPIGVGWWLGGGVLLGLGILSKYTMALLIPSAAVSLWLAAPLRRWVGGFVLHLLVGFVVTTPILIYNYQRDFAPLLYQAGHAMQSHSNSLLSFPEFFVGQLVLVGLLPFVLLPWAIRNRRRLWADPRLRVCWCLFVLPFSFFILKALRGRLEANWPLISYLALWPLVAVWLLDSAQRWRLAFACFALPVGCTLLGAVHSQVHFTVVPPKSDRIVRIGSIYDTVQSVAERVNREYPGWPVFTSSYQWTAQLRFQGLKAEQIPGMTRASHFTQIPANIQDYDQFLIFCERPLHEDYVVGFGPPQVLGLYTVDVRGVTLHWMWLIRYDRLPGATKPATPPATDAKP